MSKGEKREIDEIIELIFSEARSRTKVDHSKAIIEVLSDIIVRCNEVLNQFPFYERRIKKDDQNINPNRV